MNVKNAPKYYYKTTVTAYNPEVIKAGTDEIIKTAQKYFKKDLKQLTVLDVGCGEGEFTIEMSKHFKKAVGVEPFKSAAEYAKKHIPKKVKNVEFYNAKIEEYKTKEKYDMIVAITIFEHLADQKKAFDKMFSLLKPGGIIYITAPNKYWIFEQHYGFPFLSWLPLPVANAYVRLFTKVDSYEDCSYSRSYAYTRHFFDGYPCTYKFVLPFNLESAYFGCGRKGLYSWVKRLGVSLIKTNPFFWNFSKGFIIVVRKNK